MYTPAFQSSYDRYIDPRADIGLRDMLRILWLRMRGLLPAGM